MKLKSLTRFGTALGLFAMLLGSAQAVVITQYTSEAAWHAAVGSNVVVEDFEDAILAAPLQSITGSGTGPSINGTVAGKLWDIVDAGIGVNDTVFTFSPGIFGMGGLWDLAGPGGKGTSITVRTSTGLYTLGGIPNTTAGSFWGFTISEAIMDVILAESGITSGVQETYTLDNMVMAVPEPTTLALLGLGLIGIGFVRRKRAV